MKDLKLIETLVISYFHENKKINQFSLEDFLKESVNIEISEVTYEDNILTITYGPKTKSKKLIFEVHNDKIKHKKEENG
jgi:hypothetical protein